MYLLLLISKYCIYIKLFLQKYFKTSTKVIIVIILISAQSPHPWVRPSPGG